MVLEKLFDNPPGRPDFMHGLQYDKWYLYWIKKFEKEHSELNPGSVEYWSAWRKYKEQKWYETSK